MAIILVLKIVGVKRHSRTGLLLPCFPSSLIRIAHVQLVFGVVQCLSVLGAIIAIAATWNSEVVDYGPDDIVGVVLVLLIPALCIALGLGLASFWWIKVGSKKKDEQVGTDYVVF